MRYGPHGLFFLIHQCASLHAQQSNNRKNQKLEEQEEERDFYEIAIITSYVYFSYLKRSNISILASWIDQHEEIRCLRVQSIFLHFCLLSLAPTTNSIKGVNLW